jgi:hypothetical protein
MVVERMGDEIDLDRIGDEQPILVRSECALGHGRTSFVRDVIMVDPSRLDRSQTGRVAEILQRLNGVMRAEERNCLLIGPGRWGSSDPWLGIPVAWHQISSARAIVETDFPDLEVEPSLGSHFFDNLTTFGIAYLTVHQGRGDGCIDWGWLQGQPAASEYLDGAVRHVRLQEALRILVDGKSGRGIVVRDGP